MWLRQFGWVSYRVDRPLIDSVLIASRTFNYQNLWFRSISSSRDRRNNTNGNNKKLFYRIHDRQERMRMTQQNMRRRGKLLIAALREAKIQMKMKMEAIIERENIWTVPNALCVSRILVSPYLGYLIVMANFEWAVGLVVIAGVTDLLDGLIARTFTSQASRLGSFLDPMADKVLVATMFLSLTYVGLIPVFLTGLIIVRDVALATAGFYIRYKSLPPPRTIARYFDPTHATAQLAPTFISKVNTLVQLATAATTLTAPVFGFEHHLALQALWWATGATTIASAISYIVSKNTYRFLK